MSSLRRGDDSGFADVFETIERLVGSGDSAIRNLVIVGFLEDLQNISLNKSIELAAWNRWLQPQTRMAWDMVVKFWNGELTPDAFNSFVMNGGTPT